MSRLQKWCIIAALWILAIGVFLNAFNGRYSYFRPPDSPQDIWPVRFDTWTGNHYQQCRDGSWVKIVTLKFPCQSVDRRSSLEYIKDLFGLH